MGVCRLDWVKLAFLLSGLVVSSAFNVDTDSPTVFTGPNGSLFGTSVLGHEISDTTKWILVGAPKSYSDCQTDLPGPPGALYKCSLSSNRCNQVCLDGTGNERYILNGRTVVDKKDGQLLGVSLARQPGPEGKVVVCGHRWMNQQPAIDFPNYVNGILLYPWGICYTINARLETSSVEKIRPCSGEGTVITINGNDEISYLDRLVWKYAYYGGNSQFPYTGFSLASGHFSDRSAVEGVTGAPRYDDIGRVFIFDVQTKSVVMEFIGEQVNTYFGASVEALDLNNDGWWDLLVGAPLYSINGHDEGCVYVYINDGMGELELRAKITGSSIVEARFGSAIKDVGDLDKDGFPDVAIGAPFEDENAGAVYIYRGSPFGINRIYSQRIAGRSFGLTSFGTSLSAIDLDSNNYPDLVVGAHQNDAVVYLKTRPVINMEASMTLSSSTLIMNNLTTSAIRPTVTVTVCLGYSGVAVARYHDVVYTLEADYQVSSVLQSRVSFDSSSASNIERTTNLRYYTQWCQDHSLILKRSARDFLTPIPVRLSYRLGNSTSSLPDVLNPASQAITKEIAFGRECGDNGICEAALELRYSSNLPSGRDVIYLGAESNMNLDIEVSNAGEEAHQARLVISHPEDMVYVGVQTIQTTEGTTVKCEPVTTENEPFPTIDCILANPMRSNGMVLLQVRLDIGSLGPRHSEANVSLAVSTSSSEANVEDNDGISTTPVVILADVTVNGASRPEQVLYQGGQDYDPQSHLEEVLQTLLQPTPAPVPTVDGPEFIPAGIDPILPTEVVPDSGLGADDPFQPRGPDAPSVNWTAIGPKFVQQYEVANVGPGRIPYVSLVNISIPWRTLEGDWLIFITEVKGIDGVESCNTASILQQQNENILEYYSSSSENDVDDSENRGTDEAGEERTLRTTFDCETAQCVTLQCRVKPLPSAASSVIEVRARLWKYSFLKFDYGLVSMVSATSVRVKNPQGFFNQPTGHQPDTGTVKLTVIAEEIRAPAMPGWVIPVGTIVGIIVLLAFAAGMAKLGFFRRGKREKMQRLLEAEQDVNRDDVEEDGEKKDQQSSAAEKMDLGEKPGSP